jgi:DNA adenine methylase
MGSKNRIAKEILPIILKDRKPDQWYVEPFVGGGNVIDKVNGKRIGSDNNKYLIELCKKLQNGYTPIEFISRADFYKIKNDKESFPMEVVALCGILASYNGNWFRAYGGYSETKTGNDRNYYNESVRNLMKQTPKLKDVLFYCCEYFDLDIPPNSIIYCDPPYELTDKTYKEKNFNHDNFWNWCRMMSNNGHQVFISELKAPDDFECVWMKELSKTHPNQKKKSIEKLFVFKREEKSFNKKDD